MLHGPICQADLNNLSKLMVVAAEKGAMSISSSFVVLQQPCDMSSEVHHGRKVLG